MYDAREKTQAEAALIADLIKNVVEPEVMAPMEAIGWSHAAPPPPRALPDNPEGEGTPNAPAPAPASAEGGQPAPEPKPAAAPVASEPTKDTPPGSDPLAFLEAMKDPKTGLYGGKYKTREAFVEGVGHVVQMAKNAYSKLDAAEQEAQRLRSENAQLRMPAAQAAAPAPAPVVAPQATPVRSAKLDAVLSKLDAEGVVLDKENLIALVEGLSEVSDARAEQIADRKIAEREAARRSQDERWQAVDAHMQQVAPESLLYSNEIGLYVQSDPLVKEAVTQLVKSEQLNQAAELSWKLFQMAHPNLKPGETTAAAEAQRIALEAGDQVRREAVEQARKDAGVSASGASGVHVSPAASGPSQEEIDLAVQEMNAGDGTRWRALTIGRTLTDPLFNR